MLRPSLAAVALLTLLGCQTTAPQFTETALQPAIENATLAYQQGDLELAEGLWRKLLARDPSLTLGWCHLGHIGFRQHHYDAAFNAYQKCLRYEPQQPAIWQNMAVIRLRQASELMLHGSAYLPATEHLSGQPQGYQRLLQSLMLLQRASQQLED